MKTVDFKFVDAPAAESIDNGKAVTIQPTMMDVGQMFPQGDVALQRMSFVPEKAKLVEKFDLQVAEGSTLGSRHIWDSPEGITAYRLDDGNPLMGLIYVLSKTRTLTHPEHADQTYVVDGEPLIFQCRFQRQHAEELRRIRD